MPPSCQQPRPSWQQEAYRELPPPSRCGMRKDLTSSALLPQALLWISLPRAQLRGFPPSPAEVQWHRSPNLTWSLMPPSLLLGLCRGSWDQHWGFVKEEVHVTHPSFNQT